MKQLLIPAGRVICAESVVCAERYRVCNAFIYEGSCARDKLISLVITLMSHVGCKRSFARLIVFWTCVLLLC